MFALASAAVTANAYYIHPIIATVADHFGISDAMIGMVPSFNQLALAVGVFLLLPLGDRFSNRTLILIFVAFQVLSLLAMAVSSEYWMFLTASTVLGFFTIAPYLLPAYVSKRVAANRLGHSNAILTAGIMFGILIARAGAGVIAEWLNWRVVYFIAAGFMLAVTLLLLAIMENRAEEKSEASHLPYPKLLASIFPIIRKNPDILIAGSIQGLGFGIFLAIWMGIGLHLTSPEMGYGTDTVGYLAILTITNLLLTPFLGRVADRMGARRARFYFSILYVFGMSLFSLTGHSLWLMIIPIFLTNTFGPVMDITNRMTFLTAPPAERTRLMTVYIIFMFVGGGIASWAGTAVYDFAGWFGTSMLALGMALILFALTFIGWRWKGDGAQ